MSHQYCSFRLGDLLMGIEVERVQEVLRFHGATPVPMAPPAISGLINLRGQIITAVDLRSRAALPPRIDDNEAMNIVLSEGSGNLSFVVDMVGDVIEVDESAFEEPPQTLKGNARRLIRGAYKLDDELLLIIDAGFALDVCNDFDKAEQADLKL